MTPIEIVKAKRDEWEALRQRQPEWGNHVRAADEIIGLLENSECVFPASTEQVGESK
jgi:hypothetical protein